MESFKADWKKCKYIEQPHVKGEASLATPERTRIQVFPSVLLTVEDAVAADNAAGGEDRFSLPSALQSQSQKFLNHLSPENTVIC